MEPNKEMQNEQARALMNANPSNVCFGRGYPLISLQQGSLYKKLLQDNCAYYHMEKGLKSAFVEQRIVRPVHDRGGKFYIWSSKFKRWVEAGSHETFTIVSQALRDQFKKSKNHVDKPLSVAENIGEEDENAEKTRLRSFLDDNEAPVLESTEPCFAQLTAVDSHYIEGVAAGTGLTDSQMQAFARSRSDRAANLKTDTDANWEGAARSITTLDNSNGKDCLELVRCIDNCESRLRYIREMIEEGGSTGKVQIKLEDLQGSLASIDDGLNALESAIGVRTV